MEGLWPVVEGGHWLHICIQVSDLFASSKGAILTIAVLLDSQIHIIAPHTNNDNESYC